MHDIRCLLNRMKIIFAVLFCRQGLLLSHQSGKVYRRDFS